MDNKSPENTVSHNSQHEGDAAQQVADLLARIAFIRDAKNAQQQPSGANQVAALNKNLIGGIVGNILEWYDFAIFGFLAPVIGRLFFPSDDPLTSLLSAFSVFAAGFLVRPAGGIFFGYIGDHYGRKTALQLSVMMMAVPTFLIGILPTYARIGAMAPIILVLLRMVQGLSVGGEFVGSIAFVTETAPSGRKGFFSSWSFASGYAGMMLGALSAVGLYALLGHRAMENGGWRLPFLAGIFIGLAGLWMRRELQETPLFEAMKADKQLRDNPLAEAVQQVPWDMVHAGALSVLVGGGFYLLFVWWPSMLSQYLHPHVEEPLLLNSIFLLLLVGVIPYAGHLSDKMGRKPLLTASSFGLALFSFPLFLLVERGGLLAIVFAQFCFTVLMGFFLGPMAAALAEMFPVRVRYSAIGLAYNVSLSIFGGTAPMIATWLVIRYHHLSAPAVYLILMALISFFAAQRLPDQKRV